MDLHDYIRIVRRSWRIIVAAVLGIVALAALLTALTTPKYQAATELFVSTAGGENANDLLQGSSFTQRQVTTYADLITTPVVLQPVIDDLGLDVTAAGLASTVTATVPPNTVLIDITVTRENPDEAAALANAIGVQFTETVQDLERVDEEGSSPVKATVVKEALAPDSPVSPNPTRNVALGLVLGLLVGLGLALLRDLLDTRVTGEADVARVTEATVIGGIAFDKDAAAHPLIVQADPHSPRAEAFRTLRTNLQFIDAAERPKAMVFTSSLPGEGKTTTTANLALTLAASGSSVCLIEGDLRRPRLLEYMGMEGAVGLTSVLIGEVELEDVLQHFGESLTVIGSGPIPPNPSELLGSGAMASVLQQLAERFDYIIIDAPPLLPVTDAAVLSKLVDGTILVVGSKVIKREHLSRALMMLDNVDAHILGVVLNRLPNKNADAYSYYREGYAPQIEATPRKRGLLKPRSSGSARAPEKSPR